MKQNILSLVLVLFLSAAQAPLAFCQSSSFNDWGGVQRLRTNEKLVIKQKDGKEIKGGMIEATDTALTIDRDGKPLSIPRADVRQVHVIEGKAQKGKWAAIGAGVGAGAGAGIGAIKYSPDSDDSELFIAVGLMIGAGAGAVTGMLFGQSNRKRVLVYSSI
jgi:hypothetical protein